MPCPTLRFAALALSVHGLCACGGGGGGAAAASQAESPAPLRSVAAVAGGSPATLWVRASATAATAADALGVGMAVRVDGLERARFELRGRQARDLAVPLAAALRPGSRIDVVQLHAGSPGLGDDGLAVEGPGLRVASVRLDDGASLPATAAQLDVGEGEAAFDGLDLHPGRPVLGGSGALRFVWPAALPDDLGGARVTVQARASLARGRGARMSVRVGGLPLSPAAVEVRNTQALQAYRFSASEALPAGAWLDVVYDNDALVDDGAGGLEDRNLVVASVQLDDGPPLGPEQATLDLGDGAAAFDGLDLRPGQAVLPWNGALRFPLAGPAGPGGHAAPQGLREATRLRPAPQTAP